MPGQEIQFQYLVDGSITIADPYASSARSGNDDGFKRKIIPIFLLSFRTGFGFVTQHIFKNPIFNGSFKLRKPPADNLVIYELLVRDFSEEQSFKEVLDRWIFGAVRHCAIYASSRYEGNNSWGYNPSYHGALISITAVKRCSRP